MKTIHDVIKLMNTDPMGISTKFGIPLRTVYAWTEGTRKPCDYVIMMMLNIILLERKMTEYGYTEEGLESGMGSNGKIVKKVGKKSKSKTEKA